jgi:hypothetical protein
VNQVFQTAYQQLSPAKAGDALLQNRQALAWAKAFVWANSNGVRECTPDNSSAAPVTHDDLLDETADAAS